jgi:hypothetical protein
VATTSSSWPPDSAAVVQHADNKIADNEIADFLWPLR